NKVNKEIGSLKQKGIPADDKIAEMKEVSQKIKTMDAELGTLEEEIHHMALMIPNLPHESVPEGGEADNKEIRSWGEKPVFSFPAKTHWDLAEQHDIIDFKRGAKLTGSGFLLFKKHGARLERALINYFIDTHVSKNGFTEVFPPFLVNRKSMTGTGQLPKMEADMYRLTEDDLFLIPTAEVPVTNIYNDEILEGDELPKKYVAYTPCFRREAGSYGKETRGMVRIHQFDKVEMVAWVKPEESYDFLETLTGYAEDLLQSLKLPYRVVVLSSGDLSFASAKTYDLEVWVPGMERWLEVSSVSNFVDFQARRAKIRFRPKKGGKPEFLHTLNGSGLALPRVVVGILENYQNQDGSITVPDVLIPYMNGTDRIG
ncbi:MAG: serine--tRNA ligase, partial [Candidatus Aureabacteria bacterium]|nr:serine--tRNA ligase [Candidatus Auribacterota bacterium]